MMWACHSHDMEEGAVMYVSMAICYFEKVPCLDEKKRMAYSTVHVHTLVKTVLEKPSGGMGIVEHEIGTKTRMELNAKR